MLDEKGMDDAEEKWLEQLNIGEFRSESQSLCYEALNYLKYLLVSKDIEGMFVVRFFFRLNVISNFLFLIYVAYLIPPTPPLGERRKIIIISYSFVYFLFTNFFCVI